MKKIFLFVILLSLISIHEEAYSQLEYSAFSSSGAGYSITSLSDYQCLGINPANLGWSRDGHSWHLSFFELGSSVYAEPLSKEQVRKDLFGGDAAEFPDFDQDPQVRMEAIEKFTHARLLGTASINLFGISFQDEDIGGFAFSVRSRLHWNSKLNKTASRFLFLGYNDTTYFEILTDEDGEYGEAKVPERISDLYNPSHLEHIWYNEYILGYGRNILMRENFSWYGGFALKYLQGYGMVYIDIDTDSEAIGYQALSPVYKVNYEGNPTPSELRGDGLKTAGTGFGIDLGMSFIIHQKIKVGLAVNDIGSINWDANVYEGRDPDLETIRSNGIDSYNIFSEAGNVISENSNIGVWNGLEELRIDLPTNLRIGASYRFNNRWEAGTDFYYSLNDDVPGAYREPVFALGTKYEPVKWVQFSAGYVTGGQFKWALPMGITFSPINNRDTRWEIGIATRDIASLFKQDNAIISYCMGLLRFGLGSMGNRDIPQGVQ